jgi:hypothetical protein
MTPNTGWPTASSASAMANRIPLATRRSLAVQGARRQKVARLWTNLLTLVQMILQEEYGSVVPLPGCYAWAVSIKSQLPAEGDHGTAAASHGSTTGRRSIRLRRLPTYLC